MGQKIVVNTGLGWGGQGLGDTGGEDNTMKQGKYDFVNRANTCL